MGKLPAIQFYPGDWKKDPGVQALGFFDRGVWLEILLLMYESNERGVLTLNGKPMPPDALANILGLDKQILTTTLTTLLTFGVASQREDGAIFCRRMVRDEEIRHVRAEAGKRGGNPNLLKQKSTTQDNQIPTPSSSSSSSSSSSDLNTSTPPPAVRVEPPAEIREAWDKYEQHRRDIRRPLKPNHRAELLEWCSRLGHDRANKSLIFTRFKGWQGLKEPTESQWLEYLGEKPTQPAQFTSARERRLEREAAVPAIVNDFFDDLERRDAQDARIQAIITPLAKRLGTK